MTRPVVVKFIGDATNLTGTVGKVEGRFGGLKSVLLGLGIGSLLVGEFKASTAAAEDANRVGRETEARLRSTGASAWITAGQISDLAAAEAEKVGVDDDLIQGGENMLLTFQGVRNEVGAGNDIFNRATRTALDLAAGMHQGRIDAQGLQGANVMLGKALEDPVKGINALTRVGVTFTAQQKEQIRDLVDHNDKLGAQKLILQAVGAQFGGTAEASATATGKMSAKIGNLQEKIGNLLLPALNAAATVLGKLADLTGRYPIPALAMVVAVVALSAALGIAHLRIMATTEGTALNLVVTKAAAVASKVWAAAQWLLNAALSANPIGLVIIAVAGLVAGLVIAYNKSETFRRIVTGAFNAVKGAALAVWNWIRSNWPLLLGILTGPIGAAVITIVRNWDKIRSGAVTAFNAVVTFVKGIPGKITGALGDLGSLLWQAGRNVIQGLIDGIKSMFGPLGDAIGAAAGFVKDHWPFSPAKIGPLSGSGSPFIAGQNIARMLGQGMLSGRPALGGAMGSLLAPAAALGRPGAGGGPSITVHAHTNADPAEIAREVAWAMRTSGR